MAVLTRPCLLALGVLGLACGDGDDGGLFGKGSGGAAGVGAAASGGSGGSPSGGSAGATAGGAPSGGSAGSGGTAASGGTLSTGGGGSGGAGGSSATGGKGGTSGSGGATGVGTGPCGAATCAFSAGDACCKASNFLYCSNDSLSNPCVCSGIACETIEIKCDGPEDCTTGKLCCAERGLVSSTWDVVECRETCKSDPIVGSTRREVCHPGGKPCANGTACQSEPGLPSGYAACAQ